MKRLISRLLFVAFLAFAMSGCWPGPSPTPTPVPPTPTSVPPTPTRVPTATPVSPTPLQPTSTPSPSPTPTPAGPRVLGSIAIVADADLRGSRMALDATAGRLYVTLPDRDSVAVLDAQALSLLGTVAVGPAPRALAVDSQTGLAYIVNIDHTLSIVDGQSLASEILDLMLYPQGSARLADVVVNPTTGYVYVSCDQQKPRAPSARYIPNPMVLIIDAVNLEVMAAATTDGEPGRLTLDAQADRVYTFGYQGFRGGQGVLHEIDGGTGVVRTISLGPDQCCMPQGNTAQAIAMDPVAGKVYVSLLVVNRLGLPAVDLAAETATTLDLPGLASDLAVDSERHRVYAILAPAFGSSVLWIVDGMTGPEPSLRPQQPRRQRNGHPGLTRRPPMTITLVSSLICDSTCQTTSTFLGLGFY